MQKTILLIFAILCSPIFRASAQYIRGLENNESHWAESDSIEKENVPVGFYMWNVNPRFGTVIPAQADTLPHLFPQKVFTDGVTGKYNFLGNYGAPRQSRLFFDRKSTMSENAFIFSQPYDFFIKQPGELLFTNTKSPITNLTYHSCGNKQNGEDRIRGYFATNINKRTGIGFKLDYLYGRGYYEDQSTAHFNGTVFGSFIDERYQIHALYMANHLKNAENGGIEDDEYVTNPEAFPTKYGTADMPTRLSKTWNKMNVKTLFLTQRYNIGFTRYRDENGQIVQELPTSMLSAKMSKEHSSSKDSLLAQIPNDSTRIDSIAQEEETKHLVQEFVPVTSFIHTLKIDRDDRKFLSNLRTNELSKNYFSDFYLPGDSANDNTQYLNVENLVGIELREGFNSWVKSGLKLYAKHEFKRFTLPDSKKNATNYTHNYFTLGAELLKEQGKIFHYNLLGEIRSSGKEWGEFNIEGNANLNIPLKRDTLQFHGGGFIRNELPSFYYEHYHGRNAWWDNSLDKQFRTCIFGEIAYKKTRLSVNIESIQNYTYFAEQQATATTESGEQQVLYSVGVRQSKKNIQLISATLKQDFRWGILNWENEFTYQVSSDKEVFPVPAFNGYTNLYLLFRIAKVLRTELGADLRYFTEYYAPTYSPIIGQFCVQDKAARVKIGNYPVVNAYANFHLRNTRFYVMASHVNYSSGRGRPFLVPHYPLNRLVLRLGLSWTFSN